MTSGNVVERDCKNCGHSVQRHKGARNINLTRVCLLYAVAVRPDQLRKTNSAPCGACYDPRHGTVPRRWCEIEDDMCDIDVHDTGWAVCEVCGATWQYDRPHVYVYCPHCGRRIRK